MDHLAIPVRDQERSRRFYESYFGFGARPARRYDDGVLMLYDDRGFALALGRTPEPAPRASWMHFGVGLPDRAAVLALRERLVADGVELVEEWDEADYVSVKCRDPDGHIVEAAWEPEPRHADSPGGTEFYDKTYGDFAEELTATIRSEAFGEEIGQNSWLTADEQRTFCDWLELDSETHLLEVASGSGGPALFTARETGCRVTGVDLHDAGVAAANAAAAEQGLAERARFVRGDAREPLPFDDESFDALMCIDSINHMYERAEVLGDWHRVLRSGGRLLFTDPITVTGMIRREEMVTRSGSMGEFVFTAPGVDEALLRAAGFEEIRVEDVTPNMAAVASAWRGARAQHAAELDRLEGAEANASFQDFLAVVERLASERRLSRLAYVARKR